MAVLKATHRRSGNCIVIIYILQDICLDHDHACQNVMLHRAIDVFDAFHIYTGKIRATTLSDFRMIFYLFILIRF